MKRTPLPPRTKPIAHGNPPNRKRAKPRKVSVMRDKGYLAFLRREFGCVVCRTILINHASLVLRTYGACDAAHGPVNGMASKGPDDGVIPLCRMHHKEQHYIGWPGFEARYKIDRAALAAEHYAAYLVWKGEHK
jgi:hypothetical protein